MKDQFEIDMRAHKLATEIASRFEAKKALGKPSIYNIAREVLIEDFVKESK